MLAAACLGLDIGGTGAKAGVFDATGRLLGFGRIPYTQTRMSDTSEVSDISNNEIPIEAIYLAARDAARQAIAAAGIQPIALSVASMGQTFVTLDESDRPLHPAILWYDARAGQEAHLMNERLAQAGVTGAPLPFIDAIATVSKIVWLRARFPDVMRRARRYLTAPDYLAYRLTGEAVTDPNTASSTGFYTEDAPDYDARVLDVAGVSARQLSRIQPAGTPIAPVRPEQAAEWGLAPGALFVAGANDQYAGALGAGNCRPGIVTETTGTCLALVTLAERLPPLSPGLLGGRFPIRRYQFALAYAKTAGLVLDWFRAQFYPDKTLADLESLAASVPIGSRGVTVLPHFDGVLSPQPHPHARGAFLNLTLAHTLPDMHRAILESISFSLRENIELLRATGFAIDIARSIGGGARSDLWLQIKADATGLPIEQPAVTEAATLGAAMLAAVGRGAFASLEESSAALYHAHRTFEPDAARHAQYEQPYMAYREACARLYTAGGVSECGAQPR